jgi:hypothetical protein
MRELHARGAYPSTINEADVTTKWVAELGDEVSRFKAFDPGI